MVHKVQGEAIFPDSTKIMTVCNPIQQDYTVPEIVMLGGGSYVRGLFAFCRDRFDK